MIEIEKRILIFGTGGFSEIVYDYLKLCGTVFGFVEDEEYKDKESHLGLMIHTPDNFYGVERHNIYVYVAIGYGGSPPNSVREDKLKYMMDLEFKPLTFVHPDVVIPYNSEALLESDHNFVFELNNIQPFVKIGNNNIFWSGNHLGHHSIIGDNNFFSSHVVLSGNCRVGNNNFFGVDIDIGITFCTECDDFVHSQVGCRPSDLREDILCSQE